MFENLTVNLKQAWKKLIGKHKVSAADLTEVLDHVKRSLLDADVALVAINQFIAAIESSYLHAPIDPHLTAEQFLLKLIKQELINLMGPQEDLVLTGSKPIVILMVGLQGGGKTTTCAKLAKILQDRYKKQVMLASCDIYRPAAILQLAQLSEQINAKFFEVPGATEVTSIAKAALSAAKAQAQDILIIDTAGRLHIDQAMMQEAKQLHDLLQPTETLFVVDGMLGQDAAKVAKEFNEQLALTGIILTKLDGDARGGAALSVRTITGKPIKFYTNGEKVTNLELFHADRLASRILGMGDVLTLIEELDAKVDRAAAERAAKKVAKGQFNFAMLREQLLQMHNMGGVANLLDKLPGAANLPPALKSKVSDPKQFKTMLALIDSMTKKERLNPALVNMPSRKQRICKGSGTSIQDLNKLIKHYQQLEKMLKQIVNKGGMWQMLQQAMQGNFQGLL